MQRSDMRDAALRYRRLDPGMAMDSRRRFRHDVERNMHAFPRMHVAADRRRTAMPLIICYARLMKRAATIKTALAS
jgi:hypothetical protein